MKLDIYGAKHCLTHAPARLQPLAADAAAIVRALAVELDVLATPESRRTLTPTALKERERAATSAAHEQFKTLTEKAKPACADTQRAWPVLSREHAINTATFAPIPTAVVAREPGESRDSFNARVAAAEERRARAIDRDNTARVRYGLELPTLTDDELIALAHDAAERGELALLGMCNREAQQDRRKTLDGAARLSGKL